MRTLSRTYHMTFRRIAMGFCAVVVILSLMPGCGDSRDGKIPDNPAPPPTIDGQLEPGPKPTKMQRDMGN